VTEIAQKLDAVVAFEPMDLILVNRVVISDPCWGSHYCEHVTALETNQQLAPRMGATV